jgi:ABC-type antimicrobial peptide transport system permease subunit
MVFKNLLRRKIRTSLTVLGIGIGVAAVVALGAMAEGLASGYSGLMTGSGADLLLVQADAVDISLSAVDEQVGERVMTLPAVDQVAGVIFSFVTTENLPYFLIFAYDPNEFAVRHYKIIRGHKLSGTKQIIIGKMAASNLKRDVGDTVRIYGAPYRIVGVFETGLSFEEGGGVITLEDGQAVFKKPRQVSLYQVKLRDVRLIEEVIGRIERLFPDISVSRAADFGEKETMTEMVSGFAWGIALIAVVVGGLGMMNTMVMAVFERTREIGVLRAIGWRRGQVLTMILGESLLLSLVGGLAGLGLGVAAAKALGSSPAVGSLLQGRFTPQLIFQAMLTALILGTIGGLYPAWRASRLSPLEALRYEGGEGGQRWDFALIYRLGGMAFRSLWRRRTRTLLTIGGIGIGVAVLVALGAITQGFITQFTDLSTRGGNDLMVLQAEVSDMSLSAVDERVGRAIAAMPDVEHVSGMVLGVVSGKGTLYFIVWGLDPNQHAIRHFNLVEGKRIHRRGEIMLGKTAAENLKKKVGDVMKLYKNAYRVVGIYETGVAYEESGGVVALRDAQALFQKPRQVAFYQIKLRDPGQAEKVRRQIETRFPDVSVSRSAEMAEKTNDIRTTKAIANAISMLAILVGGVGITNTMVMAVMERTREIGTLRALGWHKAKVLGMVLTESLLLSALSGLAGIVIGIGLTEALRYEPTMGSFLEGHYPPQLFIQAMLTALFLGAMGGLYPAWRASRLSPVEALRYE